MIGNGSCSLMTMNEFAKSLGVSRVTARRFAYAHPEYLVPHGKKGAHKYVNSKLLDLIFEVKEVSDDEAATVC